MFHSYGEQRAILKLNKNTWGGQQSASRPDELNAHLELNAA